MTRLHAKTQSTIPAQSHARTQIGHNDTAIYETESCTSKTLFRDPTNPRVVNERNLRATRLNIQIRRNA